MSNSKVQIQYESFVALWCYIMILFLKGTTESTSVSYLKGKGKTEQKRITSRREKPTTTKKQKKPGETGK